MNTLNTVNFTVTYRCEAGFSQLMLTPKASIYRNRLDAAADLRVQLSAIKPNFSDILRKYVTKLHSSHHIDKNRYLVTLYSFVQ